MKSIPNRQKSLAVIPWFFLLGAYSHLSAHTVQRFGSITMLKPEKVAYYKQLHAHPWPSVCNELRLCHIQNYSIYFKQIDDKCYLFSYFEYAGDDFAGDMAKLAKNPDICRWWKETNPCQIPLPDAKAEGKIWSDAEEVFHLD
jgi:L-rhamnose mutarotase